MLGLIPAYYALRTRLVFNLPQGLVTPRILLKAIEDSLIAGRRFSVLIPDLYYPIPLLDVSFHIDC